MPTTTKTKPPAFDTAFQRLEALVGEFESGDLALEASLPKFKEALELTRLCQSRLNEVENQIIKIKEEFTELG